MKASLLLASSLLVSLFIYSCSDDTPSSTVKDGGTAGSGGTAGTGGTGGTGGSDAGGAGGGGGAGGDAARPPAAPTLGAQIDRMGRPAINTATNNPFEADDKKKGDAKDAWNQDDKANGWAAKYAGEIGKNLAILDALDGVCGNQVFADKTKTDKTRYATLAGVLADDRLWVKTDSAVCATYLAVEADATKFSPNTECGGRKPSYEVMKTTYSLLAVGAPAGVTDGVTPQDKSKVAAFPYLAP